MKNALIASIAAFLSACNPITATALFPGPGEKPAYAKAPFPSGLFIADDGTVDKIENIDVVGPLSAQTLQAQLSTLRGFGTRPVVEFFFDAPIDPSTLPAHTASADDAIFLVERPSGRVMPMDWVWRPDTLEIAGAVARGVVLEDDQSYAAFLTTQIRGVDGRIGGSSGFDQMMAAREEDLPARWSSSKNAVDDLGRDDVVAVAAFTTHRVRHEIYDARALLEKQPAPTVTFDDPAVIFAGADRLHALLGEPVRDDDGEARLGWSFGTGMAHDHVAAVGSGTLHGVAFRRLEKTGAAGDQPDSGTWAFDAAQEPVIDRETTFPISFAVPKGPMPANGWPVAFFQHGLGASRAQMLAFIDTLAREGYVTVAIDADGHGSRGTNIDQTNNVAARLGDTFTGVKDMEDGFGDVEGGGTAFALFHNFVNIAAMRDQMRESVIDLSQVVVAMKAGVDLSALVPGAKIDGTRVAFLGESFGAVLGGVFVAVEPDVHLFYLDVPGGGVLEYVAPNSPVLSGFYKLFMPSTYGIDRKLDRFDPLVGMAAAVFDGADPLTYAGHVLKDRPKIGDRDLGARSLILGEVVGDEVMPNSSTNALGRALGLPILAPQYADVAGFDVVDGPLAGNLDGQTAAVVHFAPANHGDNWSSEAGKRKFMPFDEDALDFTGLPAPIAVQNPIGATHLQLRRLLRDYASGDVPTLVSTVAPRHDFDDDGVSDEDELAAGTDPYAP